MSKMNLANIYTEITEDNDGKVYEYNKDNPSDRYYWTYNTSNKKFVCQDNNGKIIKSYDGAFYEKKRTKQATATTTTEVTSEPVTESVTSNTVVSKSKTVTINSTPDEIKKDNSSNIFKIVIAIVYLCVFAIVIAIIVRLIHKKKGKKE